MFLVLRRGTSLHKQSQRSRFVLEDGSRSLRLFFEEKSHFTTEPNNFCNDQISWTSHFTVKILNIGTCMSEQTV